MTSSLLTAQNAANRLQVGRTTLYELLRSHKLAHHRVGTGRGSIRIRQEDLERYLDSCRVTDEERTRSAAPLKLKHLRLS